MKDELYYYLIDYGFDEEIVKKIEANNMFIFDIDEYHCEYVFDFLESKGLSQDEIIDIVTNNYFVITSSKERIEKINKIYVDELKMDGEDIYDLCLNNYKAYTISPIEFQKIIDYLKKENDIEEIKEYVILNPEIIDMKLEKFIEYSSK